MFSFRRARDKDPNFEYYIGRLIGASEMVSHWMQLREDPEAKEMGRRLGMVVAWFLDERPRSPRTPAVRVTSLTGPELTDEQVTLVTPPKPGRGEVT